MMSLHCPRGWWLLHTRIHVKHIHLGSSTLDRQLQPSSALKPAHELQGLTLMLSWAQAPTSSTKRRTEASEVN
eukprot:1128954-Pelagomonas_calceolata.AAC.1